MFSADECRCRTFAEVVPTTSPLLQTKRNQPTAAISGTLPSTELKSSNVSAMAWPSSGVNAYLAASVARIAIRVPYSEISRRVGTSRIRRLPKVPVRPTALVPALRLIQHPAAPGPGQVQFATRQGFKGLEADAVVLCEAQKGHQHSSEQYLYVAASRARHVLAVADYSAARSDNAPPA